MSPNQKPIISSVNDLPHTPGVSMTVEKGFGIELILRVYNSLNWIVTKNNVFDGFDESMSFAFLGHKSRNSKPKTTFK